MDIPLIGFAAYSGTGKTTVLERLIRVLTERGLRVGVIKHDGHDFDMDQPGKDTYRHAQAGAEQVLITSPGKTALLESRGSAFKECAARMGNVDVILVEGFKEEPIPRIGLCRKAAGKGLPGSADSYIALITDDEALRTPDIPCFSFEDTQGLADFIMKEMRTLQGEDFTHFNDQGRARMVDVGEKAPTSRRAVAAGRVLVNESTFALIRNGGVKKGDVLTVAQIAGIMAAKRTPEWIPMCHPVQLNGVDLRLWLDAERLSVEIEATVGCDGRTGVEMEALTAVAGAALTVYDMCKAVQRDMVITDIRLMEKTGGVHGEYHREEEKNE